MINNFQCTVQLTKLNTDGFTKLIFRRKFVFSFYMGKICLAEVFLFLAFLNSIESLWHNVSNCKVIQSKIVFCKQFCDFHQYLQTSFCDNMIFSNKLRKQTTFWYSLSNDNAIEAVWLHLCFPTRFFNMWWKIQCILMNKLEQVSF